MPLKEKKCVDTEQRLTLHLNVDFLIGGCGQIGQELTPLSHRSLQEMKIDSTDLARFQKGCSRGEGKEQYFTQTTWKVDLLILS